MGYIIIMDCLILVSTVHTIYLKTVSLKIVVDTVVVIATVFTTDFYETVFMYKNIMEVRSAHKLTNSASTFLWHSLCFRKLDTC